MLADGPSLHDCSKNRARRQTLCITRGFARDPGTGPCLAEVEGRSASGFFDIAFVDPHTAGLHNPELLVQGTACQDGEELFQAPEERGHAGPRRQLQHHSAMRALRRESEDVAEVVVECDQSTTFRLAGSKDDFVRLSPKAFIAYGGDIVASRAQEITPAPPDVLIHLESHAVRSVGTGTIRSRDISAPYAMAAKISSWTSWG